jgi:predicted ATPase
MASFYKGWAASSSGGTEHSIALMQQGIVILDANNVAYHRPYYTSLLAQIHARTGDVRLALALCTYARERAQRTEDHIWEAELHRIEGEVRRIAGHAPTEVEECLDRALDVSQRQGAKIFELRAATALARLWRDEGRGVESRDLLAPVYGWFTEGFDTLDLIDAKSLLAELSA